MPPCINDGPSTRYALDARATTELKRTFGDILVAAYGEMDADYHLEQEVEDRHTTFTTSRMPVVKKGHMRSGASVVLEFSNGHRVVISTSEWGRIAPFSPPASTA